MATAAETELVKLRAIRTVARGNITTNVNAIDSLLNQDNPAAEDVADQLSLLMLKKTQLQDLNSRINALLPDNEEEIKKEYKTRTYEDKIYLAERKAERRLRQLGAASINVTAVAIPSNTTTIAQPTATVESKLPTLELHKFKGEYTKWPGFWSQFKSTIHDRVGLKQVEKFRYLLSYLQGEPLEVLEGFEVSDGNYDVAIKLLEERYGQNHLVVNQLMNKIRKLAKVEDSKDILALRKLYNSVETNLRSLKALGIDTAANSVSLCPVIIACLPDEIRLQYSMNCNKNKVFDLDELVSFVKREVEGRETCAILKGDDFKPRVFTSRDSRDKFKSSKYPPREITPSVTAAALNTNVSTRRIYCIFCKSENHATVNCRSYTLEEKKKLIKNMERCFICTRTQHKASACTSKFRQCQICQGRHNAALCERNAAHKSEKSPSASESVTPDNDRGNSGGKSEPENTSPKSVVSAVVGCRKEVLLGTAMAVAKNTDDPRGGEEVRCILDNCSQATFIKEEVSRKLKLPIIGKQLVSIENFGNDSPTSVRRNIVCLTIENKRYPNKKIEIRAIEVPYLCKTATLVNCSEVEDFAKMKGLILADEPTVDTPTVSSIGILIGADNYYSVVTDRPIERINGPLVAIETILGWAVQGPIETRAVPVNHVGVICMKIALADDEAEINKTLRLFWEIESLGIQDRPEKNLSGEAVLEQFRSETTFKDGRYHVKFPWVVPKSQLPNNRRIAEIRMKHLIKTFKRDPNLYLDYKEIIDDQLNKGIAVEVIEGEPKVTECYYIPHQPVKRDSSSTTKLRIVLDGSSHEKGKPSLNTCIASGPNLNPNILHLLIRFRGHRVAIMADIEKAFLQVALAEEETDFTRFFWVKENLKGQIAEDQFKVLKMTRVPFGITTSPFLLSATIRLHAEKYVDVEPEAVTCINEDLCVDDLLSGDQDDEKAYEKSVKVTEILKSPNMNLRKWKTNSPTLRERWTREGGDSEEKGIRFEGEANSGSQKILGLLWMPTTDQFSFDLTKIAKSVNETKGTKRQLLGAVAQIFDPLGMISPYTIRAKMMLQLLWQEKTSWDEDLPQAIIEQYNQWKREMPDIRKINIERCYFSGKGEVIHRELHGFCDASLKAFATVIYIRYVTATNGIYTSFVTSKARVAPLNKELSLPRLELMGCYLGARLITTVKEALKDEDIPIYLWTDSTIALHWARGEEKEWAPFVQNRVRDIQKLVSPKSWSHCAGIINPADIPTRGSKAEDLANNNIWWEGAPFLRKPQSNWPTMDLKTYKIDQGELTKERRKTVLVVNCEDREERGLSRIIALKSHNSAKKIFRITAYVKRFIDFKVKKNPLKTGPITAEEIQESEFAWVRCTQKQDFAAEVKAIQKGDHVDKKSSVATLKPFLNQDGIMVVGGRLEDSNLNEDEKHPVILKKDSRLSELFIIRSHAEVFHSGIQSTYTQSRGRYWIVAGRQLAKKVINKCRVCRRQRAKPGSAPMAQLPKERTDRARVFENTGVDFCGPLYVKIAEQTEKCYILLCTCAVTRAVHLELVPFLTTHEFLLALRRSISRRGIPSIIYSDNAKTFQRGDEDLRLIWKNMNSREAREFYGDRGIQWKFITDRASWAGGFWERMVRTVKTALRKVLARACLSYQELEAVVAETETITNSRPMTYVHSEVREPMPLTPSHFLIGDRLNSLPPQRPKQGQLPRSQRQFEKRLKYREVLMDRIWNRFKKEYLKELRSRAAS